MIDNKYEFKIGDEVIDVDGDHGRIIDICTCDRCKERGFYELVWESDITHGMIYITNYDAKCGFSSYYQIGKHIFSNLDKESVLNLIDVRKKEIKQYERQLKFIEAIENGET